MLKKEIRDCKIYSPFSHYKGNGFEFKRLIGPKREGKILVSLFDDYKKIKTTFIHNYRVYSIIQICFIEIEIAYL